MAKIQYISLEEAVKELRNRQAKMVGWNKVQKIIGTKCPLPVGTYGFLWRHVATSRWEDIQFARRCEEWNLKPIWGTFIHDQFLTRNPSKTRIGRVKWREKVGLCKAWVIDPIVCEGLSFSQIKTIWGEGLIEFHKCFRETINLPTNQHSVIDLSKWVQSFGKASDYYFPLMSFMTVGGIYFESFETVGVNGSPQRDLKRFKEEVVIPAIEKVEEFLGMQPLIVEHPVPGQDEKIVLEEYPPLIGKFLEERNRTSDVK